MGALLWRGPSAIDGAPLIVVATTGTDNTVVHRASFPEVTHDPL